MAHLDTMEVALEKRILELEKEVGMSPTFLQPLVLNTLKLNRELLNDVQYEIKELKKKPRT
jgi:hypothetical protein